MGRGKGPWNGRNDLKKSPGAGDLRVHLDNSGDTPHMAGL